MSCCAEKLRDPSTDAGRRRLSTLQDCRVLANLLVVHARCAVPADPDFSGRDPLETDVKAAAPLAAVSRQLITVAHTAGGSVPELKRNAVSVGGFSIREERFAAAGIGARQDQSGSRHPSRPSDCIAAATKTNSAHPHAT